MARTWPNNLRRAVGLIAVPDAPSVMLAGSMALATNTSSPMSHGVGRERFQEGDRGYGVNRSTQLTGPIQTFGQAVVPVARPANAFRGAQAGPSDQPGYPSTGGPGGALGWLSLGQSNHVGYSG